MNELLEKYWQGETTLEEEAQLREHFQQAEPPPHLRHVAALFQHYEARPQLGKEFDRRIDAQLKEGRVVSLWPALLKVAAAVMLFVAGALWLRSAYVLEEPTTVPVAVLPSDTYEDPEKAYEEAKQALLLVSSLMNEGTEHLSNLEEFSEAQRTAQERPKTKL